MIIGIEGGIGTGKTATLIYLLYHDFLDGKRIFCNSKLKFKSTFINADYMSKILDKVKNNELDMTDSTIGLQELHNYVDSRNASTKKNKAISYWLLQSRHTGKGSCDIIFDTQELRQVDIRFRNNTDMIIRPMIISSKNGVPELIKLEMTGKIGHKYKRMSKIIDVSKTIKLYNTHEVVEF